MNSTVRVDRQAIEHKKTAGHIQHDMLGGDFCLAVSNDTGNKATCFSSPAGITINNLKTELSCVIRKRGGKTRVRKSVPRVNSFHSHLLTSACDSINDKRA